MWSGCSIAWYDRQIGWSERFLLGNARRWAVEQVNGVVVEIETDLVTVELDGAVEVTDGNDDYFEGPVHETAFR